MASNQIEDFTRMLDEKKVKYDVVDNKYVNGIVFFKTPNKQQANFSHYLDGHTHVGIWDCTPEQAIAATVGRRDTMELWPEWEQVLFANVTDEVAQDNLNECVHELLERAATMGRSCASCPEMDNPDSYISHLQSALKWHDEHVPRPTNPRNTCVVLKGKNKPDEVLFIHEEGGVTHYLPESAGTCKNVGHDTFICSECGAHVHITNLGRSYLDENGKRWYSTSNEHKFRHCPNCGRQIVEEEAE